MDNRVKYSQDHRIMRFLKNYESRICDVQLLNSRETNS